MQKLKSEDVEPGEFQWDLRRIVVGAVILLILFGAGVLMVWPKKDLSKNGAGTLGALVEKEEEKKVPSLPTQEDVQKIIVNAQSTLSQITSENLTSSQAAIQKIISDLKKLQENKDAVGVICDLVCKDK